MIDCPKCKGGKDPLCSFPAFPNKKMLEKNSGELMKFFACTQCGGSGKVVEEMIQWIKDGEILRNKRIAVRVTLRDAAKSLGLQCSMLSEMERGIIKPDMSIEYN